MPWALISFLDFSRLASVGPIALPLALGFAGIYWLVPKGRFGSSLAGTILVSLALLLGGCLLIWGNAWAPETVLFFAFSGIAIVSGGLLITQRNPVRAALSFALVVLSTCGLFLLLAAPFLMAATIIVYAGAIVVTFLFVIMLAQQEGPSDADHRSREPEFSCIAGFVLLGSTLYLLQLTYDTRTVDRLLTRLDQALEHFDTVVDRYQSPKGRRPSLQALKEDLENLNLKSLFDEFQQEVTLQRGYPEFFTPIDGRIPEARSSWLALVLKLNRSIVANEGVGAAPDGKELDEKLEEMRKSLIALKDAGVEFRDSYGRLQTAPEKEERLAPFSRPEVSSPDQPARSPPPAKLPAENVASLGRSLFTDFLVPVELAGALLLVATIGAIAIAGRRQGALR
jgi:NADH:ubiquinone oxidoreductase subunit 6 (subunit J)